MFCSEETSEQRADRIVPPMSAERNTPPPQRPTRLARLTPAALALLATGLVAILATAPGDARRWLVLLPFVGLVSNVALVARLGKGAGATLAERLKWLYLLLAIAGGGVLVFLIERDAVPQKAAIAAFTLVLSFRAGRELLAHAGNPTALALAARLTRYAALAHGALLAAALVFASWPGPRA